MRIFFSLRRIILLILGIRARKMAKKLHKEEWAVGKSLEAALELMGWQAELLRGALRQVQQEAEPRFRRKKAKV